MKIKKQKRETNTEFVNRLMEFSPTGALTQVMIVQAIGFFTEQVVKAGPKTGPSIVSGEAWFNTAKYLQTELDKYLNS